MRQYDTECATTLRKGGEFAATAFAVIARLDRAIQ
jgi:hypothetical protein